MIGNASFKSKNTNMFMNKKPLIHGIHFLKSN